MRQALLVVLFILALILGTDLLLKYGDDIFSHKSYTDTSTGFHMDIPEAWRDVGYDTQIEEDRASGARIYTFTLSYLDWYGVYHPFTAVSKIIAVPRAYASDFCVPQGSMCAEVVWLGRNDIYSFYSIDISPEAWGACMKGTPAYDDDFYKRNELLCSFGREVVTYPERGGDAFSILEPR